MKKERILGLANRLKKEGDEEASTFLRGLADDGSESDDKGEKKGLSEREMDMLAIKLENSLKSKESE